MSSSPEIGPDCFQNYTFSLRSHWSLFQGCDEELFGEKQDMDQVSLKVYQDLLVFAFMKENIPPGSRILDVGGGDSRILRHFAETHECWNIDKLEGVGNGPKYIGKVPYKFVRDYMGNFNAELPENYFDFVFSISTLEHVNPQENEVFDNVIDDIDRVLKPAAHSLHLFDVVFKKTGFWTNKFIYRIFQTVDTINTFVHPETVKDDPDLYYMSKETYDRTWIRTTKRSYEEFGRPASLNILWRKST